jgi:hypothetical protein
MSSSGNLKRPLSEIDPLAYQPFAHKRERETHAESVHDDLSNNGDIRDREVNLPFNPVTLLTQIAAFSDGKLDSKYRDPVDALTIIQANPQLESQLEAAWKDKSFGNIRDLSKFQDFSLFATSCKINDACIEILQKQNALQ